MRSCRFAGILLVFCLGIIGVLGYWILASGTPSAVMLRIKNRSGGTLHNCLVICNRTTMIPLGELRNGATLPFSYRPSDSHHFVLEYSLHHRRYLLEWNGAYPRNGIYCLRIQEKRAGVQYRETEPAARAFLWTSLTI